MPYWKATYWEEKVSDLFFIVTTNSLLFSGKTAFLKISADFITEFQKKIFVAQLVPEISAKTQVSKSARWVFLLLTVYLVHYALGGKEMWYTICLL